MTKETDHMIQTLPADAFLIVIRQVFPLDREIIHIGRSVENHLVIDEPSVSRNHAQLVASDSVYTVQDQDSTCGTYVNGLRISQSALSSGDVLSLAGVSILYVENSPRLLNTSRLLHTGPLIPKITLP